MFARVVLVRLESRARRLAAVVAALFAVAAIGGEMVRRAFAAGLAERAEAVADLDRAVAIDPDNPDLHVRIADAYARGAGEDLEQAAHHLRSALERRPTHGGTWLRLAAVADRLGRVDEARAALQTAIGYDPHSVGLRWEAGLLALRWGDDREALDHLRYVLAHDPSRRDAAFQLARSLLPATEPVASLLPDDADSLTSILQIAIRDGDPALATAAWERRAAMEPPLRAEIQHRLLDLLLEHGEGRVARHLWAAMAPQSGRPDASNLVWNGGFEQAQLLGWGFDWEVRRTWGVEPRVVPSEAAQGRQALRLGFNAFPSLDYAGISQLVPVEPGRSYRLSALARAEDFVTRSGVKLQVVRQDDSEVLAETPAVSGTTNEWVRLETRVSTPPDVTLVRIRLRRERAPEPEGNLGGSVWLDEVALTATDGSGS